MNHYEQKPNKQHEDIVYSPKYEEYARPRQKSEKLSLPKVLALGAIGVALVFNLGKGIEKAFAPMQDSEEKQVYWVVQGDGFWDAAKHVENPNEISLQEIAEHLRSMPENKKIAERGLWAGDAVVMPKSVKKAA